MWREREKRVLFVYEKEKNEKRKENILKERDRETNKKSMHY
jgi:hypothetical protein